MAQTKRRTGKRRPRSKPKKRWLFAHPSWLDWWWLKNAEANPELSKLITGVFCVFDETPSKVDGKKYDSVKHYREMERRCKSLGWDFVPGLRFSHRSRANAEWDRLKDPKEHKAVIKQAAKWPSLMLDMEAYGVNPRLYHSGGEAYELFEAAEPWRKFTKPLYVYPPQYQAPHEVRASPRPGPTSSGELHAGAAR